MIFKGIRKKHEAMANRRLKELPMAKQNWKHIMTTDTRIIFGWDGEAPRGPRYTAQIPLKAWREGRPIKLHKQIHDEIRNKYRLFYEEA